MCGYELKERQTIMDVPLGVFFLDALVED